MAESRFSDGTGPAGLEQCADDRQELQKFCEGCSREQLQSAHAAIHAEHEPMRKIVRDEIDRRDTAEAEQTAGMRYRERNFSTKRTYQFAMLVAVLVLIALGIVAIEFISRKP